MSSWSFHGRRWSPSCRCSPGRSVPGQAPACLPPPVAAPVVDPFREPACEWCPGNRGADVRRGRRARVVRAAAAGTVSFSGVVAGTRYVVVEHAAGGLRATYGGLASTPLGGGRRGRRGRRRRRGGRRRPLRAAAAATPTSTRRRCSAGSSSGRGWCRPTARRPARRRRRGSTARAPPAPTRRVAAAGRRAARSGPALRCCRWPACDRSDWLAPHHDYPAVDVIVATGTPVVRLARRHGAQRRTDGPRAAPCGIGVDGRRRDVARRDLDVLPPLARSTSRPGDVLVAGQRVGRSGNTGRSGAPHLHLEVRVGGRQVCPQPALALDRRARAR